jgi:3-hydroxyisobutyrate dehydrogenase-like beta-hydroxyacid dehydrogenase
LAHGYAQYDYPHCRSFVFITDASCARPIGGEAQADVRCALGLRTPMLACGPGAEDYARILRPLGAQVTVLPGPPGTAATRKLLRSVFYKGLAAAVTESLRAGHAAGCADWLRDDIARVLADASAATLDRHEQGSARHARRRADEMRAAGDLLDDLGVPPRIARASQDWLEQLKSEQLMAREPGTAATNADPASPGPAT